MGGKPTSKGPQPQLVRICDPVPPNRTLSALRICNPTATKHPADAEKHSQLIMKTGHREVKEVGIVQELNQICGQARYVYCGIQVEAFS